MGIPTLSIVTIVKDDPVGLMRTLVSADGLRAAGVQHIVVDGSTDGEGAPMIPAGVERVVRAPRGIADAFNAGIAAAKGDWVWCLNAGDTVDPKLPAGLLLGLLERTLADVLIGTLTYEGETEPRLPPPPHLRWPSVRSWIPHPATFVRRSLFGRCGGFDDRYSIAMDFEFWLRAIPTGASVDVVALPIAVFAPGGLSQRMELRAQLEREKNDALRRHAGKLMLSWFSVSARAWRLMVKAWLQNPLA